MDRRGFLTAMLAACAAPALVRAESIMRIKPVLLLDDIAASNTRSLQNALIDNAITDGSDWAIIMGALAAGMTHLLPPREYVIDRPLVLESNQSLNLNYATLAVRQGYGHDCMVYCKGENITISNILVRGIQHVRPRLSVIQAASGLQED